MAKIACRNCKEIISTDQNFCPNCGIKIFEKVKSKKTKSQLQNRRHYGICFTPEAGIFELIC